MTEIVVTDSDEEVGSFSWTLPGLSDEMTERLAALSPDELEHVKKVIADATAVSLMMLVAAIEVDVKPTRMQGVASLVQSYRNLIPEFETLFELAETHVRAVDAAADND